MGRWTHSYTTLLGMRRTERDWPPFVHFFGFPLSTSTGVASSVNSTSRPRVEQGVLKHILSRHVLGAPHPRTTNHYPLGSLNALKFTHSSLLHSDRHTCTVDASHPATACGRRISMFPASHPLPLEHSSLSKHVRQFRMDSTERTECPYAALKSPRGGTAPLTPRRQQS